MRRYVTRFVLANIALTILFALIEEILKINTRAGLPMAATAGSSCVAAAAFVKDHGRAPTPEEKSGFAWRALLSLSVVSVAVLVPLVVSSGAQGDLIRAAHVLGSGGGAVLAAGVALVTSVLFYWMIRWSFGWYAKRAAVRRT